MDGIAAAMVRDQIHVRLADQVGRAACDALVRIRGGRRVIDKCADRQQLRQLHHAAGVIAVVVGEQKVVDLGNARVARGRQDPLRVARRRPGARPSGPSPRRSPHSQPLNHVHLAALVLFIEHLLPRLDQVRPPQMTREKPLRQFAVVTYKEAPRPRSAATRVSRASASAAISCTAGG